MKKVLLLLFAVLLTASLLLAFVSKTVTLFWDYDFRQGVDGITGFECFELGAGQRVSVVVLPIPATLPSPDPATGLTPFESSFQASRFGLSTFTCVTLTGDPNVFSIDSETAEAVIVPDPPVGLGVR